MNLNPGKIYLWVKWPHTQMISCRVYLEAKADTVNSHIPILEGKRTDTQLTVTLLTQLFKLIKIHKIQQRNKIKIYISCHCHFLVKPCG